MGAGGAIVAGLGMLGVLAGCADPESMGRRSPALAFDAAFESGSVCAAGPAVVRAAHVSGRPDRRDPARPPASPGDVQAWTWGDLETGLDVWASAPGSRPVNVSLEPGAAFGRPAVHVAGPGRATVVYLESTGASAREVSVQVDCTR